MEVTFDPDLLSNLDLSPEQQPEIPLKTLSPPPTTPGGTSKEYQHFTPISSPQSPQLRHLCTSYASLCTNRATSS